MFFLLWPLFALGVGAMASNKGRSFAGYFFLSLVLSPILGLIILLVSGENKEAIEKSRIDSGSEVKCYFCAELIKREAKLCKHCGKVNHPAYHGAWLKLKVVKPESPLVGLDVKSGDVIFKYNEVLLSGDQMVFANERSKAEGKTASVTFVRDGEEREFQVPGGPLAIEFVPENLGAQKVPA